MEVKNSLPLFDSPYYSYTFSIDNKSYRFTFRYSSRSDSYKMDIRDSNGKYIIRGVKLITGLPLTSQYTLGEFIGDFFVIPKQRNKLYNWDIENGRGISNTHYLIYVHP